MFGSHGFVIWIDILARIKVEITDVAIKDALFMILF